MKIVNREEFLKMPEGTLFCKYSPCVFGEVEIKGESLFIVDGGDFYRKGVNDFQWEDTGEFFDRCTKMQVEGTSYPIDLEVQSRDGLYDKDQLFMIYEKSDVLALIAKLQECVK